MSLLHSNYMTWSGKQEEINNFSNILKVSKKSVIKIELISTVSELSHQHSFYNSVQLSEALKDMHLYL